MLSFLSCVLTVSFMSLVVSNLDLSVSSVTGRGDAASPSPSSNAAHVTLLFQLITHFDSIDCHASTKKQFWSSSYPC